MSITESSLVCVGCGERNDIRARYCGECGGGLESSDVVAAGQIPVQRGPADDDELQVESPLAAGGRLGESGRGRRASRRRRNVIVVMLVAMALVAAGGVAVALTAGPSTDSKFLKALHKQGLAKEYPSDDAAVAHAKAFCRELTDGHKATGWDSEKLAVRFYCSSFLPGFTVVQTPAQQRDTYLTALRNAGLGGHFPSDAAAVAHAQSVCAQLRAGGAQQGMPVDQFAVNNYCSEFADGFHVLETRTITGHFTLMDSAPSFYFPSISNYGGGCTGTGGYSDIGSGTEVIVSNGAGRTLAETELGAGHGGSTYCVFNFRVRLTEGQDSYVVTVSHRGEIHFTWAELTTRGIDLSLGD